MKKLNIWIVLAVVYVFVIGIVVFYRMNKGKNEPVVIPPVTSVSQTPTAVPEQMFVEFSAETLISDQLEVSLKIQDSESFESAGYTLELTYDPAILRIVDVTEGNIWEKSVVLQKDTTKPGILIYSVGRQLQSARADGDVMATVKFQILDKSVETTEVNLTQLSKSAGQNSVKTIVAEPLNITLK